jgi:superfamily I DNA/RNA helicase
VDKTARQRAGGGRYGTIHLHLESKENLRVFEKASHCLLKGATPVADFSEFFTFFKRSMHGTNHANYRSTQAICEAANTITANSKLVETLLKPMVVAVAKGDNPASQMEAAMVAREIGRVVGLGGRVSYNDVAIIFRTFFLMRNFEDALSRMGIPFIVVGATSFTREVS